MSRLIVVSFLVSGFFVGLAAASEILGIWGYVRADWNPAFGLWVVPLVFLARLHPIAVIPYVFLLSLASIGGDFAALEAGVTPRFTLLLVGLTLLYMALTEWIARRREYEGSYLPGGLPGAGGRGGRDERPAARRRLLRRRLHGPRRRCDPAGFRCCSLRWASWSPSAPAC